MWFKYNLLGLFLLLAQCLRLFVKCLCSFSLVAFITILGLLLPRWFQIIIIIIIKNAESLIMFFVFLEKFHSFYIFLCFKKKICLLQTSFGLVPRNTIYYIIIIVIISIINNIKIDCQKLRNTDSCLCKEFQSFLSLTLPCKKYEELTLVYSLRYFWNNFFFFKKRRLMSMYRSFKLIGFGL